MGKEKVRKYHRKTPEMVEIEKSLTETLGTRVIIETNAEGGRLLIDFFSPDDLLNLVTTLAAQQQVEKIAAVSTHLFPNTTQLSDDPIAPAASDNPGEDDLYSVRNFSV